MSAPSNFEQPYGVGEQIAEHGVVIIFWSVARNLRRWRRCILVVRGDADCWGLNPRFDEVIKKHAEYALRR